MPAAERAARNRNMVGAVGVFFFVFGYAFFAWAAGAFWLQSIVCGLATFIAGALIGFLFGIPRSLASGGSSSDSTAATSPGADGPTTSSRMLAVNTNLEQISDWLTKIIVGLGLVNLAKVPDKVNGLATFMAPYVGSGPHANVLALQILLYFSVFGFLSGFISTRIFLSQVINEADRATFTVLAILKRQVQSAPSPVKLTPEDKSTVPSAQTAAAAAKITQMPLSGLSTADDIVAWGDSQLALDNYTQATLAYRKALQNDPNNIKAHLGLGLALYSNTTAPVSAAISELLAAESLITPDIDPSLKSAIYENLAAAYLYTDPPGGFQTSLNYLDKALAMPTGSRARLYFYQAAANGQRYKWLTEIQADETRREEARKNALNAAKQAVTLDLGMRDRLWDIARDPNAVDNDLSVLANDPDFLAIVKGAGE